MSENHSKPTVFISYRRDDADAYAHLIRVTLEAVLGNASVFQDTHSIRPGDSWSGVLDEALAACSVVLVVIGPTWLRASDELGRRRIDVSDDWVRREIAWALANGRKLIPITVGGAELPRARKALPKDVQGLLAHQSRDLDLKKFGSDMEAIARRVMEMAGLAPTHTPLLVPRPPKDLPLPLDDAEVRAVIERLAPRNWRRIVGPSAREPNGTRLELVKQYQFASFEQAMDFMRFATPHVSRIRHHPRWENMWSTVTVAFTTWDAGERLSAEDPHAADLMDDLYDHYSSGTAGEFVGRSPLNPARHRY